MALVVTGIERSSKTKINNDMITLDDPNPLYSVEEVMNYYSNFYSSLTTSTIHGPEIIKDKAVYEFRTIIGTKG